MKTAGGVIGIVAGVISVVMAFVTLFIGGVGGALEAEGAETVIGLGWAGVFLSFLVIVFAAASITAKSKFPSLAVIILSIVTAISGGTLVAIFMVLALCGGIMAFIGAMSDKRNQKINTRGASLT